MPNKSDSASAHHMPACVSALGLWLRTASTACLAPPLCSCSYMRLARAIACCLTLRVHPYCGLQASALAAHGCLPVVFLWCTGLPCLGMGRLYLTVTPLTNTATGCCKPKLVWSSHVIPFWLLAVLFVHKLFSCAWVGSLCDCCKPIIAIKICVAGLSITNWGEQRHMLWFCSPPWVQRSRQHRFALLLGGVTAFAYSAAYH
ncbi:hypothetical protein COO60DRAFT_624573 [Scenedesmus sp. NREL 46B-D3]|nr:hypothetical protein COO60DRAFT_624573 [Scenedesmus sp. NREL 46B-D3]